ncbi:MAG TPA: DUF4332 domain-containing protein [Thiobacillaceae bacterium]|nr:DUF4332 domain-containing protein [Thiobacillaceae bacterium]
MHAFRPSKEESVRAYKIEEIEGIGPVYADKLVTAGIANTDDLLRLCASAKGRAEVSEKTGLTTSHLLVWADMADMMRLTASALNSANRSRPPASIRRRNCAPATPRT